ncbi:MAG TPA: hypothetical protein VKM56_03780, partial [Verrucomicrobiae bacterium]|nr:hypothetical protein [Verrucomicrobiae bacterium]
MEPERPIEKVLRASAAKRRDEAGPPLELPPATRRLLQAEVARTHPARPERLQKRWAASFIKLWPRFALSVAGCALLVIIGWQFLASKNSQSNERLIARNEPAAADRGSVERPMQQTTPPGMAEKPLAVRSEQNLSKPGEFAANGPDDTVTNQFDSLTQTTQTQSLILSERSGLAKKETDKTPSEPENSKESAVAPEAVVAQAPAALADNSVKRSDSYADLAAARMEKTATGATQHFATTTAAIGAR